MARKPTLRQQVAELLNEYDGKLQAAFLESIRDVRSQLVLKDLVARLEARDIEGALRALNIERAAFSPLEDVIRDAYGAGGKAASGAMPTLRGIGGNNVVFRFDVRAPRAEAYLQRHGAGLVKMIEADTQSGLREVLNKAMREGRNPRSTISDIAGRVNRATGRREGGMVGLTRNQMQYVSNARTELEIGTRASLQKFLGRKARDRRFDRTIEKAIREGKPLGQAMINRMIGRYNDNLLAVRAETLARTEALTALQEGKREGFVQGLEKTNYPPEAVSKIWRSAGDGRVRHTHAALNGQSVQGLEAAFTSSSGSQMKHPGDTSLGASGAETIQCRCDVDYRIDFSYGLE